VSSSTTTDLDPPALAITNNAVVCIYRPLLEPLGLTQPQYLMTLVLWDHQKESTAGDTSLSVKRIADTLQLDSAADERSTHIELRRRLTRINSAALWAGALNL
jgi:MarR family transcriptional regulator, organic hydroperoxide resistance regulator